MLLQHTPMTQRLHNPPAARLLPDGVTVAAWDFWHGAGCSAKLPRSQPHDVESAGPCWLDKHINHAPLVRMLQPLRMHPATWQRAMRKLAGPRLCGNRCRIGKQSPPVIGGPAESHGRWLARAVATGSPAPGASSTSEVSAGAGCDNVGWTGTGSCNCKAVDAQSAAKGLELRTKPGCQP